MTEQTTPQAFVPPPVEPPPVMVQAPEGTRLEQLHATYATAKAEADDAAKRLKAVTDAIKLELTQAAPEGTAKIDLTGPAGPALRLSWTESTRFDSTRFKADHPDAFATYSKTSGTWRLAPAKGGE